MNRSQQTFISLVGLLLALGSAHGATVHSEDLAALYGDEAEIGIATGRQQLLHLAPVVASVITAKDIQRMGATTLDEALRMVPGLHVSLANLSRLTPLYSIRGIHTSQNAQVLVTIDGIPINDSYTGGVPSTFRLPVADISRIEVIRGPGSAMHGADAFAGVINVVTKTANDIHGLEIGARAGSFDTSNAWAQYGRSLNGWDVTASVEHASSKGDPGRSVDADLATKLQGQGLSVPSLASSYPLQTRYNVLNSHIGIANERWAISLRGWSQRNGGVGPGIAHAIDPVGRTTNAYYRLDVKYRFAEELQGWELSARSHLGQTHSDNVYQIFAPGATLPVGDDGNLFSAPSLGCPSATGGLCLVKFVDGVYGNPAGTSNFGDLEMSGLYKKWVRHIVQIKTGVSRSRLNASETKNFGPGTPAASIGDAPPPPATAPIWTISGALTDVTGTPYMYVPTGRRTAWYLAGQDEWKFAPDWTLTGGARYDQLSDIGSVFNHRLALVWAMNYNLTGKLLWGSAFRAPSFGELFQRNNPAAQGNSQLKAERTHTLDFAIDYRPSTAWQHNFNAYAYEASNLIEFLDAGNGLVKAQNTGRQQGYGVELESKWKPSDLLQWSAAFAWQHSKNSTNNTTVADAPGRRLFTALFWKPGEGWGVYGSINWVMDRARASGDQRSKVADYAFANVTVRKQLTANVELSSAVRNLFDKVGREPSNGSIAGDFPLEGRSVMVELRYRLPQ